MSSGTLHRFVPVELHSSQQWAFAYTGNLSSCVSIMETTVLLKNRMKAIVCIFFSSFALRQDVCHLSTPSVGQVPFPYTRHSSVVKWHAARGWGTQHLYSYRRCRDAGKAANLWAAPSSSHIRSWLLHIFILLYVTEIFTAAVANRRLWLCPDHSPRKLNAN